MGLFGKKLTNEEIQQMIQELESDDLSHKEYRRKALELEKYAPIDAAYYLGCCYFNGYDVEQNFQLALQYMEKYVNKYPTKQGLAWYIGATVHYLNDDYTDAVEWYARAIDLGLEFVKSDYAYAAYLLAAEMRNLSGKTLKVSEYNLTNQACIKWYMECCNAYSDVIQTGDAELDDNDWCAFAKSADMMLAMAYQGTLVDLKSKDNGVGSLISASFRALDAKINEEQNEFWKAYAFSVAQKMDENGKSLFAETLRLFTCLNICRYENKSELFYRALWHRDYVYELLDKATDEEREAWNINFVNLSGEYSAMERKYDRIATNYMLDGILPNIAPEYPEDAAVEPESCQSFMNRFHVERRKAELAHQEKNNPDKTEKKKGLFGLFRK